MPGVGLSEPSLGLDLGTSKTCVAVVDSSGTPRMISDASGHTLIPSVVSFAPDGNVLVGAAARQQLIVDPKNTMQCDLRPQATVPVATRAGEITPTQLEAILLDHARRLADAALQLDTRRVVLTLPAGLDDARRQEVVAASAVAGLTVELILTSPAAAAYAYRMDERAPQPIAVYDFGGGKFECTILEMRNGQPAVLATASDPLLGGIEVDQRIVDGMIEAFRQVHQIDLGLDPIAVERLFWCAEEAKLALDDHDVTNLTVPAIATSIYGKPLDLKLALPRPVFLGRIKDLVERTIALSAEAMLRAGVNAQQVAEVLLVGGMTRIPSVRERAATLFQRWGRIDVPAEDACALGAARFASLHKRRSAPTLFPALVSSQSGPPGGLPRPTPPPRPAAPAPAPAVAHAAPAPAAAVAPPAPAPPPGPPPASQSSDPRRATAPYGAGYRPADGPPHPGALGAEISTTGPGAVATSAPANARMGRISTKKMFTAMMQTVPEITFTTPRPVITEVIASRLAVSTVGGFCDEVVAANLPIPAANTRVFTTGKDGQRTVQVHVCQGPSRRFEDNVPLGTILLEDLPPRPRGQVRIAVTFSVDADGVLEASARDEASGRAQMIRVQLGAGAQPTVG
jgi:molecular chaperone DnaK